MAIVLLKKVIISLTLFVKKQSKISINIICVFFFLYKLNLRSPLKESKRTKFNGLYQHDRLWDVRVVSDNCDGQKLHLLFWNNFRSDVKK